MRRDMRGRGEHVASLDMLPQDVIDDIVHQHNQNPQRGDGRDDHRAELLVDRDLLKGITIANFRIEIPDAVVTDRPDIAAYIKSVSELFTSPTTSDADKMRALAAMLDIMNGKIDDPPDMPGRPNGRALDLEV